MSAVYDISVELPRRVWHEPALGFTHVAPRELPDEGLVGWLLGDDIVPGRFGVLDDQVRDALGVLHRVAAAHGLDPRVTVRRRDSGEEAWCDALSAWESYGA